MKSGLIRRAQGAPAIGRGKPLPKIGYANTSIPTERKFSPVLRTHAIAVFNPKPPSERSPNPKPWGNWEGIGDFCLQKCQRGRQLSPLSEATSLDSAATPRAVFLNLVTVNRF